MWFHSTPYIDDYAWPLYSRDNPMYYIFNAEGGYENQRAEKFGRGPMATSCAFWGDFLPRVRSWSGTMMWMIIKLGVVIEINIESLYSTRTGGVLASE